MVALDLLARHLVLEGLAAAGLLASGGRVLNVLASAQRVPFQTAETIRARVAAVEPPSSMFAALLPVGVAADAWLQDAAASGEDHSGCAHDNQGDCETASCEHIRDPSNE